MSAAKQNVGRSKKFDDDEESVGAQQTPPAVGVFARLKRVDWIVLLLLFVTAGYSRFHDIANPRDVVFDEAHFTKFLTWYASGHYYVDIHPP